MIGRNLSNILISDILIFSSRSFYDHLSVLGILKFYSNLFFHLMLPGTWSKFSSIIYLIISSSPLFALLSFWNSYKLVVGLLGLIFCFYLFSPILHVFALFYFLGNFFNLPIQFFYWNHWKIHFSYELLIFCKCFLILWMFLFYLVLVSWKQCFLSLQGYNLRVWLKFSSASCIISALSLGQVTYPLWASFP